MAGSNVFSAAAPSCLSLFSTGSLQAQQQLMPQQLALTQQKMLVQQHALAQQQQVLAQLIPNVKLEAGGSIGSVGSMPMPMSNVQHETTSEQPRRSNGTALGVLAEAVAISILTGPLPK
jgi:hypothetical protein